jgi:hypothetical protein
MPKPSRRPAGQPHQDVLNLAQLLERPPTDAAAAAEVVKAVSKALTHQKLGELATGGPSITKQLLSSVLEAALHTAEWLVAARRADTVPQQAFVSALSTCILFSSMVMQMLPGLEDLPSAVLQPTTPGGYVPGGGGAVLAETLDCTHCRAVCLHVDT